MANNTHYAELADIFFNKIKDYDLANTDEMSSIHRVVHNPPDRDT